VGIEVVHDQRDFGHAGIPAFQEPPNFVSPVQLRAALPDRDVAPSGLGLAEHEDRRRAVAFLFVVDEDRGAK
jgi:hypothetical protein